MRRRSSSRDRYREILIVNAADRVIGLQVLIEAPSILTLHKSHSHWVEVLNFKEVVYAHSLQWIAQAYQSPLCRPKLQRTQFILVLSNILPILDRETKRYSKKDGQLKKKGFLWYRRSGRWPPSETIAQVLKSLPYHVPNASSTYLKFSARKERYSFSLHPLYVFAYMKKSILVKKYFHRYCSNQNYICLHHQATTVRILRTLEKFVRFGQL